MGVYAGIDLGGTKIEAALFDADFKKLVSKRVPTPRSSYGKLLGALVDQVLWLRRESGDGDLSVGIGSPGFFDRETGVLHAANLPASGKSIKEDLCARVGEEISFGQDLKCFALSEANGGAGTGFEHVFGLIIGTGIGGAYCHNGMLLQGQNGFLGEVGHIGLPLSLAKKFDLPLLQCGCGLTGCIEQYASGPGLTNLARHMAGTEMAPQDIVARAKSGESTCRRVLNVWHQLVAQVILTIQVALDPDCVILGGGLSNIDGVATSLAECFEMVKLPGSKAPAILDARFGDSSGSRGAAMLTADQVSRKRA